MRCKPVLLAALLALLIGAAACAPTDGRSESYRVPMRDGTELAADAYFPREEGGPFPTVLMRTPYNKAGWNPTKASRFTDNGYVLVVQDTRGRFASAGDDSIFFTDGVGPNKDGYDTIEWIVGQAWSDGNVGMRGASAPGLTSYYATAAAHPALKCAVVGVAASSLYHDAAYPGGVYRMRMVTQWATKHGMASMLPLLAAHPRYDELWARADLPRHAAGANASIYHWGGWYDCMSRGTIRAFQALQERGGEGARGTEVAQGVLVAQLLDGLHAGAQVEVGGVGRLSARDPQRREHLRELGGAAAADELQPLGGAMRSASPSRDRRRQRRRRQRGRVRARITPQSEGASVVQIASAPGATDRAVP